MHAHMHMAYMHLSMFNIHVACCAFTLHAVHGQHIPTLIPSPLPLTPIPSAVLGLAYQAAAGETLCRLADTIAAYQTSIGVPVGSWGGA